MTAIRFETADRLSLEGELRQPEGTTRGAAVLCHPLPEGGGSKDHPLLWAIRNDLAGNRGLVVLGFNYRGVMGSEGTRSGRVSGSGVDELKDVAAAVARVREEADGPLVLIGWSFGANVALRYTVESGGVAALALIGIPLNGSAPSLPDLPTRDYLRDFAAPVLLVVGEADPFSPVPGVRSLARRIPSADVLVLPDTDHFFRGREREVAEAIGGFVDGVLGQDG
ncbi:MAG: alpha/beta hydrolase [Actinomycetota bacterium]